VRPVGDQACEPGKEPRDRDRRDEGDEARQEQQQERGAVRPRKALLVHGSTQQRRSDHEERPAGDDVGRCDATALARRQRDDERDERRRHDGDGPGEREPAGRGHALRQHRADRGTREPGGERADRAPHDPAHDDPAERHGRALARREQPELPGPRPVPREAAPRVDDVAAEAACSEQREREQQRGGLAADEEQAPAGDVRAPLGFAELLLRGGDCVRPGACGEGSPGLLDAADEAVDLPKPRPARRQRPHPRVAAIRAREDRRGRQVADPLSDDERRRRRAVVAPGFPQRGSRLGILGRVVGRLEEVAEELAGAERRGPHLHEPQPGDVRQPPATPESQHLAALGRARPREAPGAEDHVRREPVDRGEPEEASRNGALSEERERDRLAEIEPGELRAHFLVESRVLIGRACGDPEPDRPHRAAGRRQALDRLGRRAVGRDRDPAEDAGEGSGRDREPERGRERAAVAPAQAPPREPGDVPRRAHADALRRRR
jgi:hypothetical protein